MCPEWESNRPFCEEDDALTNWTTWVLKNQLKTKQNTLCGFSFPGVVVSYYAISEVKETYKE